MSSILYIDGTTYLFWSPRRKDAELEVDIAAGQDDADALRRGLPMSASQSMPATGTAEWLDQQLQVVEARRASPRRCLASAHRHHFVDVCAEQLEIAHADRAAQAIGDSLTVR